ncbi:MAG: phage tail protein [Polyangiaceae bacterium]
MMRRKDFIAAAATCTLAACNGGPTGTPAPPGILTVLPISPYPAETRLWSGGVAVPSGWMLCQGQTLSIAKYAALFQALGSAFATGDGVTFRLPTFHQARVIAVTGKNWA